MIVVDLEMSGLDIAKCGIWQIGALELENPNNQFIEEARIDDDDEIINVSDAKRTVYEVTGKTEKDFRDKKKQSQKQMLENFFKWCEKIKIKNFICQNPHADISFIESKARKYGLKIPFHIYRAFDLHSIAQIIYLQKNKKFLIKDNQSDMSMSKVMKFCGLNFERGDIHNALNDAKITAECFSRLVYGKTLTKEFKKFPIPVNLKK
jgi:DNA polymerase III epsilon subunit-like protein